MAFRFSGHETFPCRYSWLPKAYEAIKEDPRVFSDEAGAMIRLGVGKNMVRAIRFWAQVVDLAQLAADGICSVTPFGQAVFAADGFDPFLEDVRTLWLIHWKLASIVEEPLFAWDYLLNQWQHPEITRSGVIRVFERETKLIARNLSRVTLEQHFDTFLHTYVPTRSRKGEILEDNLDCPLVELELIQRVGERRLDDTGRREPIYAFRREAKDEVTPELFAYCLADFWDKRRRTERTLTFRDVSVGHGSPGQLLKLPEADVRDRLESIEADSGGLFHYEESASRQQVVRIAEHLPDLLPAIYKRGRA